jgi:DNA-binding NtrC family response regulator
MKKESILVVEDEDIMRESLVDWFSSEDHKVDAADDGEKALKNFNLSDYDVMIVDLKLPGRDGLLVLSEVRVKNPKTKVIIITAYPSVDTAVEAMRRGAVDYLAKPFELERLGTSITKARDIQLVTAHRDAGVCRSIASRGRGRLALYLVSGRGRQKTDVHVRVSVQFRMLVSCRNDEK